MTNSAGFLPKLILAALMTAAGFSTVAHAEKRIALVVGNSIYQNGPSLDNPKNDAKLIADTLRELGFTLIGAAAQIDLDKAGFDRAVQRFGNQLSGADVALFYYAGHGMQLRNSNYLVPVDANPMKEADVDFQLLDAALVLRQMEGSGTRLNLVILDACRNNPFGGRGLRSFSRGLAQMQAPEGTLISYATQPGNVALDGDDGHSPFTRALAATMRKAGLDILQAFNEVGVTVKRATGGVQQPWMSSSPIDGRFYFTSPSIDPSAPPATMQPSRTEQAALPPPALGSEPKLLGRFDDWAAYTAVMKGSKICYALTKARPPKANSADRAAGQGYAMITTRPAEKIVNEVSILADYQVMHGSGSSTLQISGDSFAMFGQDNGYWISNAAEEAHMVDVMRRGGEIALRGYSAAGAQKNDVYSLRGFAQALDRVGQECH